MAETLINTLKKYGITSKEFAIANEFHYGSVVANHHKPCKKIYENAIIGMYYKRLNALQNS